MRTKLYLFLLLLFPLLLSSCYINSYVMLKADKEYKYLPADSLLSSPKLEYEIAPNDQIELNMYSNKGFKIIDIVAGNTDQQSGTRGAFNLKTNINYVIDPYGNARIPVLDTVPLAGLTVREAELYLEELFSKFYREPFVQINVLNKRAIVFPGGGSDAQVINLTNRNTTLMEVLAQAGGISRRGKANTIKLIRKDTSSTRNAYLIDLSTMDGLNYTDIIVQANDYIYVEPTPEISRELLQEVTPIISLLTNALVVWAALRSLTQ